MKYNLICEAHQITKDNWEDISNWCGFRVEMNFMGEKYIGIGDKQGDWDDFKYAKESDWVFKYFDMPLGRVMYTVVVDDEYKESNGTRGTNCTPP